MWKNTIAIIGSNINAIIFATRAKALNIKTICFAWNNCLDAKDVVDKFYLTDVLEPDKVVDICKKENIQGILCATESALYDTACIASKLGLVCNSVEVAKNVTNKFYVRSNTNDLQFIKTPKYFIVCNDNNFDIDQIKKYPVIIKPVRSTAKKGITVVYSVNEVEAALDYARSSVTNNDGVLIEEFLADGDEYSVESLSFNGKHRVIQITNKISSGPPHCIELEYHQGDVLNDDMYSKVVSAINELLTKLEITFGPCHTEIKIIGDKIYLIELNARMGGGGISYPLTELSTGYPYISAILLCSLNIFLNPVDYDGRKRFAGIYYVVKQNEYLKSILDNCDKEEWFFKKEVNNAPLVEVTTNYERKNWFMYLSDHKISFKNN